MAGSTGTRGPWTDAKSLYKMRWPTEFNIDSYNAHFNETVATAGKVGQAPIDDLPGSLLLRQGWWHIIASPPARECVYYQAALEARTVTRQHSNNVEHRNDFRVAMLKAIARMVKTGWSVRPQGLPGVGLYTLAMGPSGRWRVWVSSRRGQQRAAAAAPPAERPRLMARVRVDARSAPCNRTGHLHYMLVCRLHSLSCMLLA